jgi:ATP-dependent Lon protease
MEVIRLSGYTEDEKVNIAERYLIPKQMKNNGLKNGELVIREAAVRDIVRYYTREAGVRNLEREISKICRKVVKEVLLKKRDGPCR